jgi:hypothetical protein
MAYQGISTGTGPNTGSGDSLLGGAVKVNSNFLEIYNALGDGSSINLNSITVGTASSCTKSIIAGSGLTGGGQLNENATLSVDSSVLRISGSQSVGIGSTLILSTDNASRPTLSLQNTSGSTLYPTLEIRTGSSAQEFTTLGRSGVEISSGTLNNSQPFRIHSQNNSFTATNQYLWSNRPNTSAFYFFQCQSDVDGTIDTELAIRGDGFCNSDGGFSGAGADYAEMFEWDDGNSNEEDRRGYSVCLSNEKIRLATENDLPETIIGVISSNPTIIGDASWSKWDQKYLKDDFGSYILEDYTLTEWFNGDEFISYKTEEIPPNIIVPETAKVRTHDDNNNKLQRRKLNPAYDPDLKYVSRAERKEWDYVGLMGKLRIRKGQPVGDRWIKMRDVTQEIEEWLVR